MKKILFLLIPINIFCQAKKVSELPTATTATDNSLMIINMGGTPDTTKKIAASNLWNYFLYKDTATNILATRYWVTSQIPDTASLSTRINARWDSTKVKQVISDSIAGYGGGGIDPAYGQMGRTSDASFAVNHETYTTLTGLSNSGLQALTEEQGDTAIKILSGGAGKYRIKFTCDCSSIEPHIDLYLFINSTRVDLTMAAVYDSDDGNYRAYPHGEHLVTLAENDIIRLRAYNYHEMADQTLFTELINVIIERIDE